MNTVEHQITDDLMSDDYELLIVWCASGVWFDAVRRLWCQEDDQVPDRA